ncbi:dihydrodipicolinate synthase family protein [Tichowtungia aerotolerans]|uniref:Dihydrodipicolinate synthase family protein n=1 Tax=Tichowtungia aerotolerans TaxID=2697043 RepID=A0A6P1MBQ7_9BACT|nr:dihydrodipicolinate synthase family protein [Tichowtungia aerotolerans]QHI68535.1 dihydrodipicolinate synthase family protein [Tichowtungia aerotolerans]
MSIQGVIPPLVTPFDAEGEVDESALRSEVRFLLDAGVHGLSLGGSTGEGALLLDDELVRGLEILSDEAAGRCPLVCGIIRNSTRDAVRAATRAVAAGADALMVTPTFYHGTDARGNYSFYQDLSGATDLPIIIYNVIAQNPITPEMMMDISQIRNVMGIKQSVGGMHGFNAMMSTCGALTNVYGAQDDMLVFDYLLKATGSISAILTVFPELCVQQWDAVQAGRIDEALEIHSRLVPVWQMVSCAGMAFPGRVKKLLELLGRTGGLPRKPVLEPEPDVTAQLRYALEQANLLPEELPEVRV